MCFCINNIDNNVYDLKYFSENQNNKNLILCFIDPCDLENHH